jgi:hypothetical protein
MSLSPHCPRSRRAAFDTILVDRARHEKMDMAGKLTKPSDAAQFFAVHDRRPPRLWWFHQIAFVAIQFGRGLPLAHDTRGPLQ